MRPLEIPSQPLALVVDDDAVVRTVATQALSQAGMRVRQADNAERALELVMKERPDIVLLDVSMPKGGGLGALAKSQCACTYCHREKKCFHPPILRFRQSSTLVNHNATSLLQIVLHLFVLYIFQHTAVCVLHRDTIVAVGNLF